MTSSDSGENPKDKADVPPVLPSEQPHGSDSGRALTPDELDFTDSPLVAEVENGRFVVSADGPPSVAERPTASQPSRPKPTAGDPSTADSTDGDQRTETASTAQPSGQPVREVRTRESPEAARSLLSSELERSDSKYAVDLVSKFGEKTVHHRTASDDVVDTFDNLVLWYAQNVPTKASTMRTASLLLQKSEFSEDLSPREIKLFAKQRGLTRSSTIGDLLDELE